MRHVIDMIFVERSNHICLFADIIGIVRRLAME